MNNQPVFISVPLKEEEAGLPLIFPPFIPRPAPDKSHVQVFPYCQSYLPFFGIPGGKQRQLTINNALY